MADPTEPWCDHGDWKHRGPCYVRRDDNRPSKRMYMEPWPPVFLPEGRPLGPATSADLLELDAVPEPVDSAAPVATHLPGCAPIGPDEKTGRYRKPDDVHARTLARART